MSLRPDAPAFQFRPNQNFDKKDKKQVQKDKRTPRHGKKNAVAKEGQSRETKLVRTNSDGGRNSKGFKNSLRADHLLNFKAAEIDRTEIRPLNWTARKVTQRGYQQRKDDVKKFLNTRFRFVLKSGATGTKENDEFWKDVAYIAFLSDQDTQCSICLDTLIAPQVTKCGHLFCLPCLMRHYHTTTQNHWARCPVCFYTVDRREIKPVEVLPQAIVEVGRPCELCLLKCGHRPPWTAVSPDESLPTDLLQSTHPDARFSKQVAFCLEQGVELRQKYLGQIEEEDAATIEFLHKAKQVVLGMWLQPTPEAATVEAASEAATKAAAEAMLAQSKREEHLNEPDFELPMLPIGLMLKSRHHCKPEKAESAISLTEADDSSGDMLRITPGKSAEEIHQDAGTEGKQMTVDFEASADLAAAESVGNGAESGAVPEESSFSEHKQQAPLLQAEVGDLGNTTTNDDKEHYFYQVSDGQPVYLHPLNVLMLKKQYGSLDKAPRSIELPVLEGREIRLAQLLYQVEQSIVTPKLCSQHACLWNLPIESQMSFLELDFQKLLDHDTISAFKEDTTKRAKKRKQKARSSPQMKSRPAGETGKELLLMADHRLANVSQPAPDIDALAAFPTLALSDSAPAEEQHAPCHDSEDHALQQAIAESLGSSPVVSFSNVAEHGFAATAPPFSLADDPSLSTCGYSPPSPQLQGAWGSKLAPSRSMGQLSSNITSSSGTLDNHEIEPGEVAPPCLSDFLFVGSTKKQNKKNKKKNKKDLSLENAFIE